MSDTNKNPRLADILARLVLVLDQLQALCGGGGGAAEELSEQDAAKVLPRLRRLERQEEAQAVRLRAAVVARRQRQRDAARLTSHRPQRA